MSQYEVARFLFHFNRERSARDAYAANPRAALDGYDLSAEEREALVQHDFTALYRMGTHPLLLIYMANNLDVAPPDYVAAVRRAVDSSPVAQ
ncbi:MAG TPA: aromatic ring-opening dioxygenase subunit LigA [Chloroflexota bacterium]|nr:aromatic ring-opening dioxygenase subunit LigA [Chloroflexota bacterium]